jgi:hypothetical protein
MYTPRLGRTLVAAAVAAICSIAFAGTVRADAVKCKAAIIKASAGYAQARAKALQKCEDAIVKGKLDQSIACATDPALDSKNKPHNKAPGTIAKARTKLTKSIGKACGGDDKLCGGDTTGEDGGTAIGFPATCPKFEGKCSNAIGTTDCTGIDTCLLCIDDAAVDQAVGLTYASLVTTDPKAKAEKLLNKCQAAIGKATVGFFKAKSKALSKCWANVNKKATPPCPTAAEALKIATAAGKVKIGILKACAGKDKAIGGSDVNADFTPTQIGFPATCNDVDPVGATPSCAGAIADLQDLIDCVTCVNQFKADCADAIGASTLSTYPSNCNPGPTPTVTPTPKPTLTPTVTPTPGICGDGQIQANEFCEAGNPNAPGAACGPDFTCTNCNCACPSTVHFAADATSPDSILDTGWTAYRTALPSSATATSGNPQLLGDQRPCGVCAISGPIPNVGPSELEDQRCSNDTSLRCTASSTCSAVANTCTGGTNKGAACGVTSCADPGVCNAGTCVGGTDAGKKCCLGGDCRTTGTCEFFFGSNLPLAAGGVSTCVLNQFNGPVSGTANVETGEAANSAALISRVFLASTSDQPCSRCLGDATINDGVLGGTCDVGPRQGLACDGNGKVVSRPDFGTTSLDCPSGAGTLIAALGIDLSNATDPVTKTLTASSPNCTGSPGDKCLCQTCNNGNNQVCSSNADCPDPPGPIAAFCGGKRCLGGVNSGAACTGPGGSNSECPGSSCAVPGQPGAPSGCVDDTTISDRVMECADPDGDGEGESTIGPIDKNCTVVSGHAQRGCDLDSECGGTAGSCGTVPRACFLTGGGTFQANGKSDGSDTLIALGMEDPPMGDISNPTLGAVFCVAPTGSTSVNGVAGLPGPARVTIKGTATGRP